MIEIILLSGFLGAGKTTFLGKLLNSFEGEKIGVIINEFGKVNIDAKLIQREGIDMAELSNGSIFCACIKDKFVDSLIEMSKRDIRYLFIEASGLADPSNMGTIIEGVNGYIENRYEIKGEICIVDGMTFLDLVDLLPALERQVKHANAIIVNKVDLIDDMVREQIIKVLKEMNPVSKVFFTSYCNVDIKNVLEQLSPLQFTSEETTNTFENRLNTFIVKSKEMVKEEDLLKFIEEISESSYRIKGFVKTEKGIVQVSGVGKELEITPWEEELETELVVISAVGIKMLSLITSASEKFLKGRFYI